MSPFDSHHSAKEKGRPIQLRFDSFIIFGIFGRRNKLVEVDEKINRLKFGLIPIIRVGLLSKQFSRRVVVGSRVCFAALVGLMKLRRVRSLSRLIEAFVSGCQVRSDDKGCLTCKTTT